MRSLCIAMAVLAATPAVAEDLLKGVVPPSNQYTLVFDLCRAAVANKIAYHSTLTPALIDRWQDDGISLAEFLARRIDYPTVLATTIDSLEEAKSADSCKSPKDQATLQAKIDAMVSDFPKRMSEWAKTRRELEVTP